MKGYVYVLSNPAMPGIVKIGRSKSGGQGRADQLYKNDTAVPLPFVLEFEMMTSYCCDAERRVHERLDRDRVNQGREFFSVELSWAIQEVVAACLEFQLNDPSVDDDDYIPIEVIDSQLAYIKATAGWASANSGVHQYDIVDLVEYIPPGAWVELKRRRDERVNKARRNKGSVLSGSPADSGGHDDKPGGEGAPGLSLVETGQLGSQREPSEGNVQDGVGEALPDTDGVGGQGVSAAGPTGSE